MIMNSKLENIFAKQRKLTNFCLKGEDITNLSFYNTNLNQYKRLIYNIFEDSLSSAFPLTKNVLTEEEWNDLIAKYMQLHKSSTPLVWKMPLEFVNFIAELKSDIHVKYTFLNDLLKFEWYEIEIYMQKDKEIELKKYKSGEIFINPNSLILKVNYPVHIKNARLVTENDYGEYFVLIYRDPNNFKVLFNDISKLMAAVTEIIATEPTNFNDLINFIKLNFISDLNEEITHRIKNFITWGVSNQLFFTQ